ncbi:proline-rich protein 29-like [Ctenopharyngodon idella]|uniref:proline-rich protein 29-like n=1 Tax=Ctenopharyngodon idella TaxID=7959 RepID=UPI00223130FA|nr:proline-rich protein 29-like [Ctenopharyngodon idella]
MMMPWTVSNEKQSLQLREDPSNIQILQQPAPQPTTNLQQFSAAVASPFAPVRPGHIREDLVELMMIQNAQMHQIIMNSMSMSVLNTFNYTHAPETARINMVLEEEPDIYHHYYPPGPDFCYPGWVPLPQQLIHAPPPVLQNIQEPPQHAQPVHTKCRDRKAVPPPPPPSATQAVGADIPPAVDDVDVSLHPPHHHQVGPVYPSRVGSAPAFISGRIS